MQCFIIYWGWTSFWTQPEVVAGEQLSSLQRVNICTSLTEQPQAHITAYPKGEKTAPWCSVDLPLKCRCIMCLYSASTSTGFHFKLRCTNLIFQAFLPSFQKAETAGQLSLSGCFYSSRQRGLLWHILRKKKERKREKLNCLLSQAVIEVCFGLFAASLDLVNWLHRKKTQQ